MTGTNLLFFFAFFVARDIRVFDESYSFPVVGRHKILVDLWKGDEGQQVFFYVQVAVCFVEIHVATLGCGLAQERVFASTLLFWAAFFQMIDKSLLVVQEKSLAVHATVHDVAVLHVISSMDASKLT